MKETKNARFRRVAEARVNKIIRMLRLLGNCSGTNTYAYDADSVEQIFTALQIELDQARKRFSENGGTGTKAVLSFANADAGHRFVSAHHAASAGRHTSSSRRLCRYDLSGHQSVSTAGWRAGGTRMLCGIQLGAQPLPRALHRRLHLRCGGHTVLWAISAGKGNRVWKR